MSSPTLHQRKRDLHLHASQTLRTKFRFRECLRHYEAVDPKSEIGDVIARTHSWDSKIPQSESAFLICRARVR